MEKNKPEDSKKRLQQYNLAKILLSKFGVLHEYHIYQIKNYAAVCCDIGLEAEFQIEPKDKRVVFKIKTQRDYTRSGDFIKKRGVLSALFGKMKTFNKYDSEAAKAKKVLTSWTSELLWGSETAVDVFFDDKKI